MDDPREGVPELRVQAARGASLTDDSFTEGIKFPCRRRRRKDRSSIARNCRDLWGMSAIGDIFNSGGGLFLMSSHDTMRHWPRFCLAEASAIAYSIAAGSRAEA